MPWVPLADAFAIWALAGDRRLLTPNVRLFISDLGLGMRVVGLEFLQLAHEVRRCRRSCRRRPEYWDCTPRAG